MTTLRARHWENVYATKSDTQVSWFQDVPKPSLDLVDALDLAPTASVIDIGGGASRLVDGLIARGFRDLAVLDLSANALAAARARAGDAGDAVEWIVADVTEWEPRRTWDLWHDRAAFHFLVGDAERAAYVRCLRRALAPGGHVIIATFAPDGPEKCSGLPVLRHDTESLAVLLGAEFESVRRFDHAHVTPGGNTQKFQFSLFRRRV